MSFFSIAKGFHKLSSHPPPELTQKERDRLRAITIYEKTKDVSLVCRIYGISRATLYRWLRRYDPKDLNSLRNKSRRPRRHRKPMWMYEHIRKVRGAARAVSEVGKGEAVRTSERERGIEFRVYCGTGNRVFKEERGIGGTGKKEQIGEEEDEETIRNT